MLLEQGFIAQPRTWKSAGKDLLIIQEAWAQVSRARELELEEKEHEFECCPSLPSPSLKSVIRQLDTVSGPTISQELFVEKSFIERKMFNEALGNKP